LGSATCKWGATHPPGQGGRATHGHDRARSSQHTRVGAGHGFIQPWPVGPTDKRRDQIFYYQDKHDRARQTLRGIDEQVRKAETP
jgi:hypothetical protein